MSTSHAREVAYHPRYVSRTSCGFCEGTRGQRQGRGYDASRR